MRRIRPIADGRPSGIRATSPKSTTPSRPSARILKLPGCGSACSRPTSARPGEQEPHVAQGDLRCASSSGESTADDSGAPSTHSLTITFARAVSTCGTTNSALPANPIGRLLLGGALQGVVQLLADPGGQLRRPAA